VTIENTSTTLSLDLETDNSRVQVYGQLATVNGSGIANQPIFVTLGQTHRAVSTNQSGWYQLTVTNVTAADETNPATVPVSVQFNGTANLQDSRDTETANLTSLISLNSATSTQESVLAQIVGSPLFRMPSILFLIVIVFAGALGLVRRYTAGESGTQPVTNSQTQIVQTEDNSPDEHLAHAREALSNENTESAIKAAYASIRRYYQQDSGIDDSLTHREFISTCDSQLLERDRAPLHTISEAYEQATFTGEGDIDMASEAVEAASSLLENHENST
jgi:hypothetical protein